MKIIHSINNPKSLDAGKLLQMLMIQSKYNKIRDEKSRKYSNSDTETKDAWITTNAGSSLAHWFFVSTKNAMKESMNNTIYFFKLTFSIVEWSISILIRVLDKYKNEWESLTLVVVHEK
jgi:hypothetical protein